MILAAQHDAFDYWTLAADWFVGIGTVSAVVVALWSGVRGARHETQRAARARGNQALLVVAEPRPQPDRSRQDRTDVVTVANGSSAPVFEVELHFDLPRTTAPDGAQPPTPPDTVRRDYLLPGEQTQVDVDPDLTAAGVTTRLHWVDDYGYRWSRRGVGRPVPESSRR